MIVHRKISDSQGSEYLIAGLSFLFFVCCYFLYFFNLVEGFVIARASVAGLVGAALVSGAGVTSTVGM